MTLRTIGNYDGDKESRRTGLECKDPSKTVQADLEDADINMILKNFGVTGKLPQNVRQPMYGDFTGIDDYRSAIEAVRLAEESFNAMPAEVRAEFRNDPQLFLEFCETPGNEAELRRLGLIEVAPAPAPVPAPVPPPSA